ncbi:MAG: hypothetical protein O2795_19025 [Acidobacteria bacterium]|nr:hypothetical protein [Acidobacteriota bacterium]
MAIYAYLACPQTRDYLFLGKALRTVDQTDAKEIFGFWMGSREDFKNFENPVLNRALWRFIADHAGKKMVVLTDDPLEPFQVVEEYTDVTDPAGLESYADRIRVSPDGRPLTESDDRE